MGFNPIRFQPGMSILEFLKLLWHRDAVRAGGHGRGLTWRLPLRAL